ncbi:MAG: flavin reductase family protein [Anaerolineales bacterium]
MKVFYTHDEIEQRYPYLVPGIEEPSHRHFAFQPARPANLLVSLDRVTGEINVSAGTIGPLSWDPYTIAIHCSKSSLDSSANIQQVGAECVVALPGDDIIPQTWMTALNLPRGVNEAKVARLTLYPSRLVKAPSVAECPVNLECVVEYYREQHSHFIAFLRILGASIDESLLTEDPDAAMHRFPTWEVDDVDNTWHGSVERLGVLGEFLAVPRVRPARGWGGRLEDWLLDLRQTGELSEQELQTANAWLKRWNSLADVRPAAWSDTGVESDKAREREQMHQRITRLCTLMAWDELDELHRLLQAG